ncbi:MAG: type II secretion system protein GspN [Nitrospirota bacterium]
MFVWLRKASPIIISLIGYLLVTVSVFLLFLYLGFPFRQIEKRIIGHIEEKTSIKLDIREDLFRPPAVFILKGVKFSSQTIPFLDGLYLEIINARVNILSLLKKRIETDIKAEGAGGNFQGRLVVGRDEKGLYYNLNGGGINLDLERIIQKKDVRGNNISGRLKLDLVYSSSAMSPSYGTGLLDLDVAGLNLKNIEVSGFPIREILFSSVAGKVGLKGEVVNIERLIAKTNDIELIGSGNIIIRNQFRESMLNLTFNINRKGDGPIASLLAPFTVSNTGRPIILAVKGTLDHPLYYLNDIQLNR